jgi:hypothetical protein
MSSACCLLMHAVFFFRSDEKQVFHPAIPKINYAFSLEFIDKFLLSTNYRSRGQCYDRYYGNLSNYDISNDLISKMCQMMMYQTSIYQNVNISKHQNLEIKISPKIKFQDFRHLFFAICSYDISAFEIMIFRDIYNISTFLIF